MKTINKRFENFLTSMISIQKSDKVPSGFCVDSKWVGNALDNIISYMNENNIKVIPELEELKQYLRVKGNSLREKGNFKYWYDNISPTEEKINKIETKARKKGWVIQGNGMGTEHPINQYISKKDYEEWYKLISNKSKELKK